MRSNDHGEVTLEHKNGRDVDSANQQKKHLILQIDTITSLYHLSRAIVGEQRDLYTNLSKIPVKFLQMEKCQPNTNGIHANPKGIKNIMPEGASD